MIAVSGLLDIEVVPLEFETVTTPAKMEVVSHTRGRFEKTREGGEFKAVRQQMDTSNFSRSAKIQAYNASKGRVQYKDGEISVSKNGYNGPSLANAISKGKFNTRPMSQLAFEYTPEEISFNWIRDERVLECTPGRVDFYITQYPEVLIDYLGGPIYCPPSSDPNYVEPEMNMVV